MSKSKSGKEHFSRREQFTKRQMKKVAIIQSNYIPWKGYFDMIGLADEFIIYDEVQYTKNDWRNRNRIKTRQGIQWITIPVFQRSLLQKISETEVTNSHWGIKHWQTIRGNYAKAPFFKIISPELEEFYTTTRLSNLSDINTYLLKKVCTLLGIKTRISNSADYDLHGDPTERLVGLCKQVGADRYLSGPSARAYLKESLFSEEGVTIEWMTYDGYPEYPQLFGPFTHQVSIIDLLFNAGTNASHYMKFGRI